MAIPRSTLVTGAIALVSTSALIVVLLKQQATPPINPLKYPVAKEEAPPYTPAQPGALNPIAAKVLAEGGPRTPTVTTARDLRRGVVRFLLAMDGTENVGACVQQAWEKAALFKGEATEDVLTCQGAGARSLEGMLVLTVVPVGRKDETTHASCRVRLTATLSGGATPVPVAIAPDPVVGPPESACSGLDQVLVGAVVEGVGKRL